MVSTENRRNGVSSPRRRSPGAETNIDDPKKRSLWTAVYLYHFRNLTHAKIAERLGVSRPTVGRYLEAAKDLGMVEIVAKPPANIELEDQILRKYRLMGLRWARVVLVPEEASAEDVRRVVGEAAARYFEELVEEGIIGNRIGIAGGGTLAAMVQALRPGILQDAHIYAMDAFTTPDISISSAGLVAAMCNRLRLPPGRGHALASPVLDTQATQESALAQIQEAASQIDVALIGIGSLPADSTLPDTLSQLGINPKELAEKGVIGDVRYLMLDESGRVIDKELEKYCIVTADKTKILCKKNKRVIAMATGENKVKAIKAAVRIECFNTLITDERTARGILQNS